MKYTIEIYLTAKFLEMLMSYKTRSTWGYIDPYYQIPWHIWYDNLEMWHYCNSHCFEIAFYHFDVVTT